MIFETWKIYELWKKWRHVTMHTHWMITFLFCFVNFWFWIAFLVFCFACSLFFRVACLFFVQINEWMIREHVDKFQWHVRYRNAKKQTIRSGPFRHESLQLQISTTKWNWFKHWNWIWNMMCTLKHWFEVLNIEIENIMKSKTGFANVFLNLQFSKMKMCC